MPPVRIDAADDPRVSDYHAVPDGELIRRRGLFVAEGRLIVQRLIEDGRHRVRSLLLSHTAHQAMLPVLAKVPTGVPIYVCAADQLRAITGFDLHRGCLALVERPAPVLPEELLETARTIVVLEAVANPDNVGSVFRNGAALGTDAVVLSSACSDPLYRKAIRTSMGATLRVPFARVERLLPVLGAMRAKGFMLVALTPGEPSETIDEFASRRRPERLALLVGTEGDGLSDQVRASADCRVRVPIHAGVDSLNLAVATGIALSRLSTVAVSGRT
jgi:tRNA G18 (ribose-2'-O)-methylase SpoU